MHGQIAGRLVALVVDAVDRVARRSFDRVAVYLVGSATYKHKPRDVDILVIPERPRGGELARFHRALYDAFGSFVKIAGSYTGCSDRVVGEWKVWVGVLPSQLAAAVPPVLRATWRENYVAVRSPPLEHVLPPAEITVEEVARGQYGVEFCKKALETRSLEELLLEGDSFVTRRVTLDEGQLAFLRQYCRRWNLYNLRRAKQTDKTLARRLLAEIARFA
jgi:hypothetical protein